MPAPNSNISLTIYNQGTSLVRDRRTISFDAGLNTLDFTDVTARIDATSVTLTAPDDPDGLLVLEQNYLYDLVGTSALLTRYLEQTIEINTEGGAQFVGQLLSAGNQQNRQLGIEQEIILRLNDGQIVAVKGAQIRDIRFPALPGGLMTRPTLRWLIQSVKAGERAVEITYLTGGINWTADYNLLLAVDNGSFDLNGWVTLSNTSGATFTDAQVKLVAGAVKRLPEPPPQRFAARKVEALYAVPPQVEQREIFEYQLYEINRLVTVANNETKQVEFINVHDIPAKTYYVFEPMKDFIGYGSPLTERNAWEVDIKHVSTWLQFSTAEASGVGKDLPAGRLRAYQEDRDGSAVLIGEEQIGHTPKGETVDIELGQAFDLVAERKQVEFTLLSKTLLEEAIEIRLRNRKDTDSVQIRVRERLFRWSNWEILDKSHEFIQLDASRIEFRVDVPAGEEVVLTYTVRYSWPG